MKQPMKCPICGKLNVREYEMMEMWGTMDICEDYYNCRYCGYWSKMAYSDTYTGFSNPKSIKQWFYFLIHIHKAIKNGFKKFEEFEESC